MTDFGHQLALSSLLVLALVALGLPPWPLALTLALLLAAALLKAALQ